MSDLPIIPTFAIELGGPRRPRDPAPDSNQPFVVIEVDGVRQTVAEPGAEPIVVDLPAVPLTPDEIAARLVVAKREAGAAIEQMAQDAYVVGFVPAHAKFAGDRLQFRGIEDRTAWMELRQKCADGIAAGRPNVVEALFRTEANEMVTVSNQDGLTILATLFAWADSIRRWCWHWKDLVDLATTEAGVAETIAAIVPFEPAGVQA